ncbi:MAG: hypothetical protein ACKOFI_01975, partial [Phycisphaerales bacterium]
MNLAAALASVVLLASPAPAPVAAAADGPARAPEVTRALERAGVNAPEIERALKEIEPALAPDMAWLVATMPEVDLRALKADFLLRNVRLAGRARREAPWGKDLPESIVRQYVLPYASVNERRDDWRQDFLDRFAREAWKFKDPIDAVKWINDRLPDMLNVHFHAEKRKKPDQSPYESMELGWASCTG